MWHRVANFILRNRFFVLGTITLLTVFLGYYALNELKLDNKYGTILPKDSKATEDGGIIYFAKKIEFVSPSREEILLDAGKNKTFTLKELRQKIEKDYGNTPWGKRMFDDLFRWL